MSGPVFVTGHRGLLGSALRRAAERAEIEVITAGREEVDLRDAKTVAGFLQAKRPGAIIHAAAKNAGVARHEAEPAVMLADNLAIAVNVISAAADAGVPRLLYVSSACVYAGGGEPQTESAAATIIPGGSTAGYALAKIAGMALCDAVRKQHGLTFHSVIPCNLYGPGDNYHPEHATVVPGMIRRMEEAIAAGAESFAVWGSGRQTREFLHADDLAAACWLLLEQTDPPPRVNCGSGSSTSMLELAEHLCDITGFPGALRPDPSKPEGAARPVLNSSLLRGMGWAPLTPLRDGLRATYAAFREALVAGTLREG